MSRKISRAHSKFWLGSMNSQHLMSTLIIPSTAFNVLRHSHKYQSVAVTGSKFRYLQCAFSVSAELSSGVAS